MSCRIYPLFSSQLVAFLDVESRDEVLTKLVDLLYAEGKVDSKESFLRAIMERERVVSTAVGMGVAIPHAKVPGYEKFFIAIGLLKKGVDWGAIDHVPVRLVFMIGGPDDKQTEYLQLLSTLTSAIKEEERRKAILKAALPEKIVLLFEDY